MRREGRLKVKLSCMHVYMGIGQAVPLFLGTSFTASPHKKALSRVNNGDCRRQSMSKVVCIME